MNKFFQLVFLGLSSSIFINASATNCPQNIVCDKDKCTIKDGAGFVIYGYTAPSSQNFSVQFKAANALCKVSQTIGCDVPIQASSLSCSYQIGNDGVLSLGWPYSDNNFVSVSQYWLPSLYISGVDCYQNLQNCYWY